VTMTLHGIDGLIEKAVAGDRGAFDRLAGAHLVALRAVVRRIVGHPEDTADVVQDALLKAWNGLDGFQGRANFGTWLCAIGARAAIDHLRGQKRWRERAQIAYANACAQSETLGLEVFAAVSSPEFTYQAKEHIAYCFTCVGRSLPPEQQGAIVLREVMGLSNREAANTLDLSESVFRHTLSEARRTMEHAFDGLCSLVNKNGVCYQCKGLRDTAPEDRRGDLIPSVSSFDDRLAIVREANIDAGRSQPMHDVFWRRTAEVEGRGEVSDTPQTECGQD